MADEDKSEVVAVSPLEISIQAAQAEQEQVQVPHEQADENEAARKAAKRRTWTMLMVGLGVAAVIVLAIAIYLANRNFHYATGGLVSPTTYNAPVGGTTYFSDAYPSVYVVTDVPSTCQHPCNISFYFDIRAGNPLFSLFIGNDAMPVLAHNVTEGSVWSTMISEADGVYNGRCTDVEFSAGNCSLSWEMRNNPDDYYSFWGYVTVNSTTLS